MKANRRAVIADREERSRLEKAELQLGALLCEALTLLEEGGRLSDASRGLKAWYSKHQAYEKERVAREAMAKLTQRELRALGLTMISKQIPAKKSKTKRNR